MDLSATTVDLLLTIVLIAVGFLAAVAFYESVSSRDVLVARVQRLARAVSQRPWVHALAYLTTVAIGIPILIVIWTVVLELGLFLVASVDLIDDIALISVAIVGAARVLAYVREGTAHELSKAVPLALLFLLLTGSTFDIEAKVEALIERDAGEISDEVFLVLVALELSMRILTDGSHAVLAAIRRRRGIDSELGVWRTLWAAVRRAAPPMPAASPRDDGP